VADRERFDLVADVARPVPARVIGSMLGTPAEDDAKLVHWTKRVHGFRGSGDPRAVDRHRAVFTEIIAYVNELVEQRRKAPTEDLLTA